MRCIKHLINEKFTKLTNSSRKELWELVKIEPWYNSLVSKEGLRCILCVQLLAKPGGGSLNFKDGKGAQVGFLL